LNLKLNNKTMTIYDIKRMSEDKAPYFFDRKSMKFFGQTLKDFSVKKLNEERYYISAPMRDSNGHQVGITKRVFDVRTRELLDTEL
tara:strand:+ start:82 stop:339 length:258 start_codon:yes stop_codon:yes gene_type:complete